MPEIAPEIIKRREVWANTQWKREYIDGLALEYTKFLTTVMNDEDAEALCVYLSAQIDLQLRGKPKVSKCRK